MVDIETTEYIELDMANKTGQKCFYTILFKSY